MGGTEVNGGGFIELKGLLGLVGRILLKLNGRLVFGLVKELLHLASLCSNYKNISLIRTV
jgi:hypothetical protein